MTPEQQFRAWIKQTCRGLAVRNAILRERYIGAEERLTHPVAQRQAGLLIESIRREWRREQREAGL